MKEFPLRPFQLEALQALERPGHVVCVAPTGSGKSLVYERWIARSGERSLIVSPLVALARQQLERLGATGVEASLRSPPSSGSGIWIVSPETLSYAAKRAQLARWRPRFLVVDECHCLWDWGERFRPAFAQIPALIGELGIPRSLWLTATLPPAARADLLRRLPRPVAEIGDFALPPSLHLTVARKPWPQRAAALAAWARANRGSGIVFVQTREATERLARVLRAVSREATVYHAGLSEEERRAAEKLMRERHGLIAVATSAFGMGIDLASVEWVALWQAPASPLALAQSIGRAGRSGRPGKAIVFWDEEDFRLIEWMIGDSRRRREDLAEVGRFLRDRRCRRLALAGAFGAAKNLAPCQNCDVCAESAETTPLDAA